MQYNDRRYHWEEQALPFILSDSGEVHFGLMGQSHQELRDRVQLVYRKDLPEMANIRAGRFFQVSGNQYILTFWRSPIAFRSKHEVITVVSEFKKLVGGNPKILVQLDDLQHYIYSDSLFVSVQSLPNNVKDFKSAQAYLQYLQKRAKSASTDTAKRRAKAQYARYKSQDMINNPELYFGKMKEKMIRKIINML